MLLKRSRVVLLFPLLLAAGCSSLSDDMSSAGKKVGNFFTPVDNQAMKIISEPAGADVYIMGQKVGVTPLTVSQQAVFPLQYDRDKESLYGKVTFKKAGCQDFVKPVSARDVSAGMKAKLDCGESGQVGGVAGQMKAVPGAMPRFTETVEQRLKHIKELVDQGLINEEEAKAARARVLNDL